LHSLCFRFEYCEDDENLRNETVVKYELVLRKWVDTNPANEFRCFVRDTKLVGKYFSYLYTFLSYAFVSLIL